MGGIFVPYIVSKAMVCGLLIRRDPKGERACDAGKVAAELSPKHLVTCPSMGLFWFLPYAEIESPKTCLLTYLLHFPYQAGQEFSFWGKKRDIHDRHPVVGEDTPACPG